MVKAGTDFVTTLFAPTIAISPISKSLEIKLPNLFFVPKNFGEIVSYERGFNRLDKNQNFKVFNEGIKAGFTYNF